MSNPFMWFINLLGSWGLLQVPWTECVPVIVGGVLGILAACLILMASIDFVADNAYTFNRNALTQTGYWMTAIFGAIFAIVAGSYLVFCVGTLIVALLIVHPILTILGLLLCGPLLILAGSIRWSGVRRRLLGLVKSNHYTQKEGV